ncbi:glycosyltransferase family 2 protein [Glycomyces sp. NRRL B-16210]|uniref:glycosyltransferase family 2 protein n=1 Tax=Glycomyces sp. NRRL B-16210 TaxID=1463821 RepID=UPI000AE3940A|nr:glycosyltransferase family 2 protein [Glycomyces sp. NRRL B-16210]
MRTLEHSGAPLPAGLPGLAAAASLDALTVKAIGERSRAARLMLASRAFATDFERALDAEADLAPLAAHLADPAAGACLALVLGTQPLQDWHRRRALALYDLLAEHGFAAPPRHQAMHVELLLHLGERHRIASALNAGTGIEKTVRRAVEADLAHPAEGGDPEEFLRRFRRLAGWEDDLELVLADREGPLLDRLEFRGQVPVRGGQRISVVMSCHRPGPELLTAVRSVQAQTWQNWELLIVDDSSGAEFDPFLDAAAAVDPRVRLLRRSENGGTYTARNLALRHVTGVFVTGLDSDDWAHPRWLELQVAPLTENKGTVMTCSEGIRATGELRTVLSPGSRQTEVRSTSVMYRRSEVFPHIGYFDATRKAADSEFRFRVISHFGEAAVKAVPGRHTIVRKHDRSLSKSEIGEGWLSPDRYAYESAFRQWHKTIEDRAGDAFVDESGPRRFFAPDPIRVGARPPERFDLLLIGDWRFEGPEQRALLEAAAEETGATVALAHYSRLDALSAEREPMSAEVLRHAERHGWSFVDAAAVQAAWVRCTDGPTRDAARIEYPDLDHDSATAAVETALPVRAAEAAPETATAPARPVVLTRAGRRLLAASAAVALAALVGGLAVGGGEEAGLALIAFGSVFGAGTGVETARQIKIRALRWR